LHSQLDAATSRESGLEPSGLGDDGDDATNDRLVDDDWQAGGSRGRNPDSPATSRSRSSQFDSHNLLSTKTPSPSRIGWGRNRVPSIEGEWNLTEEEFLDLLISIEAELMQELDAEETSRQELHGEDLSLYQEAAEVDDFLELSRHQQRGDDVAPPLLCPLCQHGYVVYQHDRQRVACSSSCEFSFPSRSAAFLGDLAEQLARAVEEHDVERCWQPLQFSMCQEFVEGRLRPLLQARCRRCRFNHTVIRTRR
jgi:hypothetical protein